MSYISKVILAKGINLDKDYLNVLSYGQTSMLNLVESKKVFEQNDAQFIRETGRIKVKASFGTCLQANYLAFQNPDYSNEWFFAFIERPIYISDNVTEIIFEEDIWSTWFDFWDRTACYVVREHTNDDTIGANTKAESISISDTDYEMCANQTINVATSLVYCCGVVDQPAESGSDPVTDSGIYGGVPCGYRIYAFSNATALRAFTQRYKDEPEKIRCVYACPSDFFNENDRIYDTTSVSYIPIDDNNGFRFQRTVTLTSPTFGGYTPKNNKLKTYPYYYCKLVNNLGSQIVYAPEKIDGDPDFRIAGSNSATGGYTIFMNNYKRATGVSGAIEESIAINSNPSGGWTGDAIGQWQANNGISTAVGTISGLVGAGLSALAVTNPVTAPLGITGAIVSAGNTIGNLAQLNSKNEHMANPSFGGTNNLNLLICLGEDGMKPRIESYNVNSQIAKVIDDYFTKYGYATKEIKVPNCVGRQNFNYVQVQGSFAKGDLPSYALEKINAIVNRGVHIWHNHANICNFSVNNSIN